MSHNHPHHHPHHHGGGCCGGHKAPAIAEEASHDFWSTQPVAVASGESEGVGAIEKSKKESVRQESYPLPEEFEWCTVNLENSDQMTRLYELLTENYVEDADALFRFDYSAEFLRWALQTPGSFPEWLVGVQVRSSGKLVGFISAIPGRMRFEDGKTVHVAEVNFLCVHKKLRSKRLAPVLIKEVTRRVNLRGIWQAVYTAGVNIPWPIAEPRYHHRLLNVKKLVDVGFASIPDGSTLARQTRLLKLNTETGCQLRPMERRHVKQVSALLREHLKKFKYAPELSADEVAHWLMPRDKVVYAFVKEDQATNKVTDFVSFYALPSSCLRQPGTKLEAAYMYYSVATSVSLKTLVEAVLAVALKEGFDVFNCLDIMDNSDFIEELKFGRGDGILHYYVYNYRLSKHSPKDIGLILL